MSSSSSSSSYSDIALTPEDTSDEQSVSNALAGLLKRKIKDPAPVLAKKAFGITELKKQLEEAVLQRDVAKRQRQNVKIHKFIGFANEECEAEINIRYLEGLLDDMKFEEELFATRVTEIKEKEKISEEVAESFARQREEFIYENRNPGEVEIMKKELEGHNKVEYEEAKRAHEELLRTFEQRKEVENAFKERIKTLEKGKWKLLYIIDPVIFKHFKDANWMKTVTGKKLPTDIETHIADRTARVTKKSVRIQELDEKLRELQIRIEERLQARKLFSTFKMQFDERCQEYDALKEDNSRLQRTINSIDQSIIQLEEELEKLRTNMIDCRNLTEHLTGTVVDRKCQACYDEFQGPGTNDRSPRFLGCGHSFCLSCVRIMQERQCTSCQACTQDCPVPDPKELPINYAVNV